MSVFLKTEDTWILLYLGVCYIVRYYSLPNSTISKFSNQEKEYSLASIYFATFHKYLQDQRCGYSYVFLTKIKSQFSRIVYARVFYWRNKRVIRISTALD